RRHPATILEAGGISADAPVTYQRFQGAVDWDLGRIGDQCEGVVHVQSFAELLLRIPDVEDDGTRRGALHSGYQFVERKVGQVVELEILSVIKLLKLLSDLRLKSLVMPRRTCDDQRLLCVRM